MLVLNVLPLHITSHVKSLFPLSYRVKVTCVHAVTRNVLPSPFIVAGPILIICVCVCALLVNLIEDMSAVGRIMLITQFTL